VLRLAGMLCARLLGPLKVKLWPPGLPPAWRRLWQACSDCMQLQKLAVTRLCSLAPSRPTATAPRGNNNSGMRSTQAAVCNPSAACMQGVRPLSGSNEPKQTNCLPQVVKVRLMPLPHLQETTHMFISPIDQQKPHAWRARGSSTLCCYLPACCSGTGSSRSLSLAPGREPVLRVGAKGDAVQHGAHMSDERRPVGRVPVGCDAGGDQLQQRRHIAECQREVLQQGRGKEGKRSLATTHTQLEQAARGLACFGSDACCQEEEGDSKEERAGRHDEFAARMRRRGCSC
jgi:hypothetical protein